MYLPESKGFASGQQNLATELVLVATEGHKEIKWSLQAERWGGGLLWTHEECRRRGGCGTPFSVLPNQMCGYHRDGRRCHILHLSFPTAQGSWSFQLSPLFSFFFSFEFVEDCVWKSSGLIRETHSVQAILGEAIKRRQRSFDLEKWSLVLKSFKAIFARKRRGLTYLGIWVFSNWVPENKAAGLIFHNTSISYSLAFPK